MGEFIGGMQLGWSAAIISHLVVYLNCMMGNPQGKPNMIGCTWWPSHVKSVTVLSAFESTASHAVGPTNSVTCSLDFARAFYSLMHMHDNFVELFYHAVFFFSKYYSPNIACNFMLTATQNHASIMYTSLQFNQNSKVHVNSSEHCFFFPKAY